MPRLRPLVIFCVAPLLGACSGGGLERLENYTARLARALDEPLPVSTPVAIPRPPRHRNLQLPTGRGSIDLLDMLALQGCELQLTVGKANSSLGKLAGPSQQLLLQLEYLRLAPDCIRSLREGDGEALADTLSVEWERKRRQLPHTIWNALIAGPELREFWRRSPPDSNWPADRSHAAITAMEQLGAMVSAWRAGDYRADSVTLESALAAIRTADGGTLLLALQTQAALLDAASTAVHRREQRPLCFNRQANPRARIVENVVVKFFAGEVQPWLVQLDRRRRDLLAALNGLEVGLEDVMPAPYAEWRSLRGEFVTGASGAARRHVEALQPLLAACGLAPGGNG